MKRLPFSRISRLGLAAALGAGSLAFACGGISDPTRGGDQIATITGALSGTSVPANARVALVFSTGTTKGLAVQGDAPVVDGKFTLTLGTPNAAWFFSLGGTYTDSSPNIGTGGGASGGSDPDIEPPTRDGSGKGLAEMAGRLGQAANVGIRDQVSGSITDSITAAAAGFVVYVDTNGNGAFDLDATNGTSTDEIIGGNAELTLMFLKGGGALDYEKLRDRTGALPAPGYNLAWSEGRWLSLSLAELKLSNATRLPSLVCSSGYSVVSGSGSSGGDVLIEKPQPTETDAGAPAPWYGGYPAPDDPGLVCAPDGLSFEYKWPDPGTGNCGGGGTYPGTPTKSGLCADNAADETAPTRCAVPPQPPTQLEPGAPVPDGWPCKIPTDQDGGAYDSGTQKDGGTPADSGT